MSGGAGTGLGRFTVIMTDCMAEDTDGITEQRSTISNIRGRLDFFIFLLEMEDGQPVK